MAQKQSEGYLRAQLRWKENLRTIGEKQSKLDYLYLAREGAKATRYKDSKRYQVENLVL